MNQAIQKLQPTKRLVFLMVCLLALLFTPIKMAAAEAMALCGMPSEGMACCATDKLQNQKPSAQATAQHSCCCCEEEKSEPGDLASDNSAQTVHTPKFVAIRPGLNGIVELNAINTAALHILMSADDNSFSPRSPKLPIYLQVRQLLI